MAEEFHVVWVRGVEKPGLKITGSRFYEIFELIKKHQRVSGLSFHWGRKLWHAHPAALHDFIHNYLVPYGRDQASWERLKKEVQDLRVLQGSAGNHLQPTGVEFDPQCLMAPPIKGKPGHENFQVDAIRRAIEYARFGLFLDMGLGKTYIMIAVINHFLKYKNLQRILIVAPSEGLYTWVHELRRFLAQPWAADLDFSLTVASKDNRRPFHQNMVKPGLQIVLCTYRTFVLLCDDYCKARNQGKSKRAAVLQKWLKEWGPGGSQAETSMLVLDESHNIKNPSARQSGLIEAHGKFFDYRYLLSGTPAPNGIQELYLQMRLLCPGIVPRTQTNFLTEIAEVGTEYSATDIRAYKPEGVRRYDEVFKSVSLRLKTAEVLELPSLVIENVYVPLPPKQRQIYEGMVSDSLFHLKEKFGRIEPRRVRAAFPYMSMALDNPCLLKDRLVGGTTETALQNWEFDHHGKLEVCDDLLKKYIVDEGRKVILFDFHPLTIDSLAERYQQYHPLVVHGESGGPDKVGYRDNLRQLFQDPESPHKLIVGSMAVLTTSITLTAATVVIYFTRMYSLEKYLQSMKRAHRIGTTNPVVVHPLIFEDSLNIHQEANLRFKKAFDENLFKLGTLTDQQWRDIFDGRGIRAQSATVDELGYSLDDEVIRKENDLAEEDQSWVEERWRI